MNLRPSYKVNLVKYYQNLPAVSWLRSSTPLSDRNFYVIDNTGALWGNHCFAIYGVSPSFRIG